MASIDNTRYYLTFEGLTEYDRLIKEYIDAQNNLDTEHIKEVQEALLESLSKLANRTTAIEEVNNAQATVLENHATSLTDHEERIGSNTNALAVLNADATTPGSVAKQVNDAITALVNGAPEALDTLKEIADWIAKDETGTSALLNRVAANEIAIAENKAEAEENLANTKAELVDATNDLKAYVDAQDLKVYNSTQGINIVSIDSLFLKKVSVAADAQLQDAINNVKAGEMLVLEANTIAENVTVPAGVVINANGATFTGTVTVDKTAVIENATFSNPVVIQ